MLETRHFWIVLLTLMVGCDMGIQEDGGEPGTSEPQISGSFDAPQGVAFTPDWVVVSNTAFRPVTLDFGEGSITVISRETRKVVRQIPVSAANPQKLLVVGDFLYVLSSGQTRFEQDTWLNIALSPGALDRFPLATLGDATGPEASLPLPLSDVDPRQGGFGSMAASLDGEVMALACGLKALVWTVDLGTFSWLRGPDSPLIPYEHDNNDTLTVSVDSQGSFRVVSFNRDQVFSLEPHQESWNPGDGMSMGTSTDMEGLLQSLELPNGDHLGLLTIANGLFQRSDLEEEGELVAVVGPIANHMALWEKEVFVVNSGVNNLVKFHWETGELEDPFTIFPVGSNPWEMAINPEGTIGVVTLNHANQLAWVRLESGELLELTP